MLFIIFSYEHTETYEHEDTKQTFPDIQEHLGEHQLYTFYRPINPTT